MRKSKIYTRVISIIGIILLGTFFIYKSQMSRVYSKVSSELINTEEQSLKEILQLSDEIKIEKKIFSLRKHYYIFSEDILIGEVTGKLFPVFGDTLELRDNSGNLVKKEFQIKRLGLTQQKLFNISFDRLAQIEDSNKNITGYIGEERLADLFDMNHIQYFYDKSYSKIGKAKPDFFILSKDYKVFDKDNNIDYIVDGNYLSLASKYTIEIKDNSDIEVEDVIFYTIIENSIINSKTSSSSNSSNKK